MLSESSIAVGYDWAKFYPLVGSVGAMRPPSDGQVLRRGTRFFHSNETSFSDLEIRAHFDGKTAVRIAVSFVRCLAKLHGGKDGPVSGASKLVYCN